MRLLPSILNKFMTVNQVDRGLLLIEHTQYHRTINFILNNYDWYTVVLERS